MKQYFIIVNGIQSELMSEEECVKRLVSPTAFGIPGWARVEVRSTTDGGFTSCKVIF